jgi:glutaredoxin-related protein
MLDVLFVNHASENCGVFQYGKNIYEALKEMPDFKMHYISVSSTEDIARGIEQYNPAIIVYNWHPFTMPWCNDEFVGRYTNIIHGTILHDPCHPPPSLMKNLISTDPDEVEYFSSERNMFATIPLLQIYEGPRTVLGEVPIIGSGGFLSGNKKFVEIIQRVQNEFDAAIIKFHIPSATFAGRMEEILVFAEHCKKLIYKPNIVLEFSHEFFPMHEFIRRLSQNNLNIFLYDELRGHGISSAVERALSAKQPLALNRSYMFRHLWGVRPSIFVEELSLKEILSNGLAPLQEVYSRWTEKNFVQKWHTILEKMC